MFSSKKIRISKIVATATVAAAILSSAGSAIAGPAFPGRPKTGDTLSAAVSAQVVRAATSALAFVESSYRDALVQLAAANMAAVTKTARPALASTQAPDVFGSKAIAFRKLPALERLNASYTPEGREGLLDCGTRSCSPEEETLAKSVGAAAGAPLPEMARTVSAAVNKLVAYSKDADHYGTLDYWASPRETLSRQAGDCEDYALLKMALLEELGVPASSMTVVVLKDESRNLFHAILALRDGPNYLVLDNMRDAVLRDTQLPQYTPFYSLTSGKAFIHGRKVGSGKMVASVNLRAIAPGEGPDLAEAPGAGRSE